jgi:hypothetical protein
MKNAICVFYFYKHAPKTNEMTHIVGYQKLKIMNVGRLTLCDLENCIVFAK